MAKNYNADSNRLLYVNVKYSSANHFLTHDFFDMWLCFDVGPFKTLQFEKVKLKNHFKIFWFVYIFQEISGLHTVLQICSVYSE